MKVNQAVFIEKVKALYLKNPCKISSIAFFKTEGMLKKADTYEVIKNEKIYLYAILDKKLIFYWSNQKNIFYLDKENFNQFEMIILHHDHFKLIQNDLVKKQVDTIYPLIYREGLKEVNLKEGFKIVDFDFSNDREFYEAKELINASYKGHHHTEDEIKSWMKLPTFSKDLWFWIVDDKTKKKCALSINTYQKEIKETYLDWVQVHPNYQGKGIGKALIYETIRRSYPISDIIRVTGIADDFYIACGFRKEEVWKYIIKEK